MLKNNHYSRWALAKVGLVAPFIALLLMLNCKNKTEENQVNQTQEEIYVLENLEKIPVGSDLFFLDKEGNVDTSFTFQWVEETETDPPLRFIEQMPEPVGGLDAMYKFINENITYPQKARDEGIKGTVVVEFVVEKDGTVSNVKAISGVHPDLDAESVRVIKMLPKWNPGKQMGETVRCFYQIPIRFTIDDKEKK